MKTGQRLLGWWTALVMVFFYLPIVILVGFSFNTSRLNIVWEGFTFDWYAAIWQRRGAGRVAVEQPHRRGASPPCSSVVLGTGGAWLLYRYRFPRRAAAEHAGLHPDDHPRGDHGREPADLLRRDAARARLHDDHHLARHVLLPVRDGRRAGAPRRARPVARGGGAWTSARRRWQAFRKVLVPYLMPAIVSGALMSFTLSLDELIVTYFTASAGTRTLPLEIFGRVKKGLDPTLNAISTVFILVHRDAGRRDRAAEAERPLIRAGRSSGIGREAS